MTKFEEEVNKYNIFERTVYLEGGPKKILIDHFKNWHSDEEFQQLLEQNAEFTRENNIVNQINSKLAKENEDLKSQLQQQPLPVVPECVAEWIEILKTKGLKPLKNPETYGETGFTEEKLQNIVFWISEYQEDYMRAWLDGYTVEKPQLFYLKNKLTTSYLELDKTNDYFHHTMNPAPYYDMTRKSQFTQQEIDSMQTGSYELVPVEDGE
ncbi:DUF1642 domain-containing protein [Lactococcus lactis subsp. lactis]|uniref:DUF1642 domain-containing protein n=1 Tax=Lactococcus lactis TaxID=1358 RepID=UPI00223BD6D9|nr:DUF1642 domain-containing protein [Lactococcus lactis]MCT0061733.1 DUF1642 domain-containing protein [Lactococcus lactis subsp. lactis]MCT0138178.1 DUF1642 domain-containing protein [Lactococcus lactis subsp. lactis]